MDHHPRSGSINAEENVGIPDDLRCKRSDGKQWRCTAMSMPDKTVCEKHYIQAKRRAANSAMRASQRKAKRKSVGDSDAYLESKSDDFDMPIASMKVEDYPVSVSSKKLQRERLSKNRFRYSSPESPIMNLTMKNSMKQNDEYDDEDEDEDDDDEDVELEESWKTYKTPPYTPVESSKSRSQRSSYDANPVMEYSDGTVDSSSEDTGGQICHQCRRNDRHRVLWCLRCNRRGFCDSCILEWYSDIPVEEIEKVCPACRGICYCKMCLRGDNMLKVRIREIPVLDKLQYLYCLLSSVLPVVKQIHQEQCSELELEKRLHGTHVDLARVKLNADEQMCCNICRIPIIDYHRHCPNCSYDLCLYCCQDLRDVSTNGFKSEVAESQTSGRNQDKETALEQVKDSRLRLLLSQKYPDWKAKGNGSIPCPPKQHGGCNYSSLNLCRIFKMNWVAKLVKNVEEMVGGCKVDDPNVPQNSEFNDSILCQYAHREDSDDNFLYSPSSDVLKSEGINGFRKHWRKGQPIIVKQVFDKSSISSWDPKVIWKGIRETSDEKIKSENRMVKAIDCSNWSEVDIQLDQFFKGYSEGRVRQNGSREMLKLKDWPSPGAAEEFLLYQRPDFISKLPLLEYIHSRLGLLNVAAKLPHYSLQNDVGPKILISYGNYEELGRGDSVTNLHFKMRDMVYLLVHTCDVKLKGFQQNELSHREIRLVDESLPDFSLVGQSIGNEAKTNTDNDEKMEDQGVEITTRFENFERMEDEAMGAKVERMEDEAIGAMVERIEDEATENKVESVKDQQLNGDGGDIPKQTHPGAHWDVFRRQDVLKLIAYLQTHCHDFWKPDGLLNDFATHTLHDGTVFLNGQHMRKLKDEFDVEPWSFEQHVGQAVFVPAGCPFQVRNLQSNVQVGLDFLSPESVEEAARLAEEIRCLPNDHEPKLQVLEVGKISLYAASSAIKEVQKLVLDPKLGAEIGFEDPNLTAAVSENLEMVTKQREISCA